MDASCRSSDPLQQRDSLYLFAQQNTLSEGWLTVLLSVLCCSARALKNVNVSIYLKKIHEKNSSLYYLKCGQIYCFFFIFLFCFH